MNRFTRMFFRALALCSMFAVMVPLMFAQPKTIRVPQDQATIQAAINAAVNGDTVLVAEGTYSVNLLLTKKIVLGSLFIIDRDTSHISKTILDGASPRHSDSASVILIGEPTDTTTKVIGFTIRNGGGTKGAWAGVPYVLGGGIAVIGGGASILHNRIIDNHCTTALMWCGAAGIDIEFDQSMTVPPKAWIIADNLIANNVSTTTLSSGGCDGGGIAASGQGRVSNNTIIGNAAIGASYGAGGGLVIYGSPTTQNIDVSGNLFRSNSARNVADPGAPTTSVFGGAIAAWAITIGGVNYLPVAKISNNLIVDNLHASAVYVRSGSFTLINNTITGNRGGSGIRLFNTQGPFFFRMLNNIVWNPLVTTDEIYNSGLASGSYNLVRGGFAGMGNIDVDPAFVVGDTLYSLQVNSPCINAGARSAIVGAQLVTAPATDLAGLSRPRPAYTNPDMGAMESNAGRGTIRVPQDHATIQAAINAAVNGDTVLVAEGTYLVNLTLTKKIVLGSLFLLDRDTTHISRTILDGSAPPHADSGAVIQLEAGTDSTTVVTGFTITKGRAMRVLWAGHVAYYGGGVIFKEYGGGRLTNNIIEGNSAIAPSGGYAGAAAICIWNGSLSSRPQRAIIENNLIQNNWVSPTDNTSGTEAGAIGGWSGYCRLVGNTIRNNRVHYLNTSVSSTLGGGAILGSGSGVDAAFIIVNNTFESNQSYRGGGLALYGISARATVHGNRFIGNIGDYEGGGLSLRTSLTNAVASGNYFSGNRSPRGGAIAARSTISATFVNNIIVNNVSTLFSGAGLYAFNSSDLRLVNNTFAFNTGGGAPALYFEENLTGLIPNKVMNCIFWGASAPSIDMYYPNNHFVRNCIVKGGWSYGTSIYDVDPWFGVGDTLYRPDETANHVSPTFGRGAASMDLGGVVVNAPATDYFGRVRPSIPGSAPDLGAFESDLITFAEDNSGFHPEDFGVDQNYPNPFNPETKIGYRMKERGSVEVSVMNILGQRVAVLVDGVKEAGYHEAVFSREYGVERLPSGVYFYRLAVTSESGERFESVRKMILMK